MSDLTMIGPWVADGSGGYSQQTRGGLYIPPKYLQLPPSSSVGIAVMDANTNYISLQPFIRQQIFQDRYKYFIFSEMYAKDSWIRACIDYIARRATRDPNRLVDNEDPLNPDIRALSVFLKTCYEDGDFEDLYYGWIQEILKYGQAYSYVERDGKGNPIALWPLDARITYPIVDMSGTILFHMQAYNGRMVFMDKEDVLYFSPRNNNSEAVSLSTLETLYMSVAMTANALAFNEALFQNGLSFGSVFSMPNATDQEVEQIDQELEDRYTGPRNAHRHLVLKGEAAMIRDGQQVQKDMDFAALLADARVRACAVLGVPEVLIGVPEHTNRATGDTHERSTYVSTIRPWRKLINRLFTRQFIRNVWKSANITLEEPKTSVLPTDGEIKAVAAVAEVGARYNDLLEMLGLDTVPNGDYYVMKIPGGGGYVRLDVTAMPGLGDPHFDFDAYQAQQHQATLDAANLAATGFAAPPPAVAYVPPRPQDLVQLDPIGAHVIDVSRGGVDAHQALRLTPAEVVRDVARSLALPERIVGDLYVARRNPSAPGSKGGTPYVTSTGGIRYGPPPKRVAGDGSGGDPSLGGGANNKPRPNAPGVGGGGSGGGADSNASSPHSVFPAKAGQPATPGQPGFQLKPDGSVGMTPPLTGMQAHAQANPPPPPLSPQDRLALATARIQVQEYLRQAQDNNMTAWDFYHLLLSKGWQETENPTALHDVEDARDYARTLAESDPTNAYTVVGDANQYIVLQRPLSDFTDGPDLKVPMANVLTPDVAAKSLGTSLDAWAKAATALGGSTVAR